MALQALTDAFNARAKDEQLKQHWADFIKRLAGAGPSLVFLVLLLAVLAIAFLKR